MEFWLKHKGPQLTQLASSALGWCELLQKAFAWLVKSTFAGNPSPWSDLVLLDEVYGRALLHHQFVQLILSSGLEEGIANKRRRPCDGHAQWQGVGRIMNPMPLF